MLARLLVLLFCRNGNYRRDIGRRPSCMYGWMNVLANVIITMFMQTEAIYTLPVNFLRSGEA